MNTVKMWPKLKTLLAMSLILNMPAVMSGNWPELIDERDRGVLITTDGEVFRKNNLQQSHLAVGQHIKTGDILRTQEGSNAVLMLKSNAVLILAPKTTISIGEHGPDQLQHVHVHQGQLRMQKNPNKVHYPQGVVFTFEHDPHAYLAQSFELRLTPDERTLVLLEGELKKIRPSESLNP